ncbi:MAG: hypothetical protein ACTSQI_09050 [Candidatus Helarchaeota archaeon]
MQNITDKAIGKANNSATHTIRVNSAILGFTLSLIVLGCFLVIATVYIKRKSIAVLL